MYTEEKMDKFLTIVASLHICNDDKFEKNEPKMTDIEKELENIMEKQKANELCDMIFGYGVELKKYSVVEGIKMAIAIMDGRYIPTI